MHLGEIEYEVIKVVVYILELIGVSVISIGILIALIWLIYRLISRKLNKTFDLFKSLITKSLFIGLEILVAADIIRTVTIDPTFESLIGLGILILIRTFISWTLILEMEGRWPWQPKVKEG